MSNQTLLREKIEIRESIYVYENKRLNMVELKVRGLCKHHYSQSNFK